MAERTVAITTSNFDMTNPLLDEFRDEGWEIVRSDLGRRLTEGEVSALLATHGAVGMVAGVELITEAVLAANPQLRVISRCGTGFDSIDQVAAKRRGIKLLNTPDAPATAVAELTLGLILAVLRQIAQADREVRDGGWRALMGSLLAKRTVGVVGLGRVGQRVADLCTAFGATVRYCDPQVATAAYDRYATVSELAAAVDLLTIHVPLTRDSECLIDGAVIESMPIGSILVNAARGGVVDEGAVIDALESGRLSGAAFDVFAEEPYTGPLQRFPNAILTPHMGSYAAEARLLMESESLLNLRTGLDDPNGDQ
jgi:D-3-phosphoglycerate dehydrogenase